MLNALRDWNIGLQHPAEGVRSLVKFAALRVHAVPMVRMFSAYPHTIRPMIVS